MPDLCSDISHYTQTSTGDSRSKPVKRGCQNIITEFYSPCAYATIRFTVTKQFHIGQNILWEITETVALVNASVNPLLYYWKMGSIRQAVKNLFCGNQAEFFQRVTEFSI